MGGSPKETLPVVARRCLPQSRRSTKAVSALQAFTAAAMHLEMEDSRFMDIPLELDEKKHVLSKLTPLSQQPPPPLPESICSRSPTAADKLSSSNSLARARSVNFGNVEMREYSLVIGDHPCCTMGCPLSLGWDYTQSKHVPVDEFEATRPPRRNRASLRTTWDERRNMLPDVSDLEVRRAQRRLYRDRSCRAKVAACAGFFS